MTQANNYNLIVFFHPGECVISVYDSTNQLISIKRITLSGVAEEEFVHIIVKEPEMQQPYSSTRFVYESANYTFVPKVLFEKDEAEYFLNLQNSTKNCTVCYNTIDENDSVCIFSIPSELQNALLRFYPEIVVEHHLTYVISKYARNNVGCNMYIWLRDNHFDTILLKGNHLEFANSFKANTKEDFLYFVLNIFEQLLLDTNSCNVMLLNATKNQDTVALLKKYVQKVIVI